MSDYINPEPTTDATKHHDSDLVNVMKLELLSQKQRITALEADKARLEHEIKVRDEVIMTMTVNVLHHKNYIYIDYHMDKARAELAKERDGDEK